MSVKIRLNPTSIRREEVFLIKKNKSISSTLFHALTLFLTGSVLILCSRYDSFGAAQDESTVPEKVILDSDMVDTFDDGIAMLMLAKSEKIDLLGVTCVAGNSWVEGGTASALRQLELAGITDVPVFMGINETTRAGRAENIEDEIEKFGQGINEFAGSFELEKPADWQSAYRVQYDAEPTLHPSEEDAVDFIIRTVKENPGEVTIAEIGPCMNLAAAVEKAPEIVPLIKQVIYMGGAFFVQGNVTPAAEFNIWYDPESAKTAFRSEFQKQIIVPLDVTNKVVFDREHGEKIASLFSETPYFELWDRDWIAQGFAEDENFLAYLWDVLVAAILMDSDCVTDTAEYLVDVNDDYSLSYGETLAYPVNGPAGSQKAGIVLDINQDTVWKLVEQTIRQLAE